MSKYFKFECNKRVTRDPVIGENVINRRLNGSRKVQPAKKVFVPSVIFYSIMAIGMPAIAANVMIGSSDRGYPEVDTASAVGFSIAIGSNAQATAAESIVIGYYTGESKAKVGENSTSVGSHAQATGRTQAVAIGYKTVASGDQSTALGADSKATGGSSIAIGGDDLDTVSNTNIDGSDGTGVGVVVTSGKNAVNKGTINDEFKAISGRDLVGGSGTRQYIATTSSGQASVAIGAQSVASGHLSTAFGTGTRSEGLASTALGVTAYAKGKGSFAGGPAAEALGIKSIAFGPDSQASADNSTAFGDKTLASGVGSNALGTSANASGLHANAVGYAAKASADNANALGTEAVASGKSSTSVGYLAKAMSNNANALGTNALASGAFSNAVGYDAQALGLSATAVGKDAYAKNAGDLALGKGTIAAGYNNGSFNENNLPHATTSLDDFAPAIAQGTFAQAIGKGVIAIGDKAIAGTATPVIVRDNVTNKITSVSGVKDIKSAIAIGASAKAVNNQAIALGDGAQATGLQSISIGTGNIVSGSHSGALGDPSIISADDSYSIGNNNTIAATQTDVFALGNKITQTANNSVFLGTGSAVGTTNATGGLAGTVSKGTVNGITYGGFAGATSVGVISVGDVGKERRIQNVAAGLISAASTDAINGSQLYLVAKGTLDQMPVVYTDSNGKPLAKSPNGNFYPVNTELDAAGNPVDKSIHPVTDVIASMNNGTVNANTTTTPTILTNAKSGLTSNAVATAPMGATGAVGSVDIVNLGNTTDVPNSNVATVGDLRNMGWVVSASGNGYSDAVKNANEVKFIGTDGIKVTGATNGNIRNITIQGSKTQLVDNKNGTYTLTIIDPNNPDNPQTVTWKDGKDGVSPTITVDKTGNTTTISTKNADGTTSTAVVTDGVKGDKGDTGAAGQNGKDGASPTLTVNKAGTTTTITAKNADGSTITSTVEDGAKGEKGDKGDTGAAGKDGINGIDGKDGKSVVAEKQADGSVKVSQVDSDGSKTEVAVITNGKDGINGNGGGSKEKVTSNDKSVTVTERTDADGSNVYDVSVNVDGTTITKNASGAIKANTGSIQATNGVAVPNANDGDKVATVKNVADAINNSGFNLTTSASQGTVKGSSTELVNPGKTVTVDAGKNIAITQNGNTISVATKDDVDFSSVTVANSNGGKVVINNAGINAGNTKITGVAPGEISATSTDAVNGSQLYNIAKASPVQYSDESNPTTSNGGNPSNHVTLVGADGNKPVTIHNVEEGKAGTDAVNVNQLNKGLGDVHNHINDVADNADAGTAAAMAAAGLPQAYLPGKSMVALAGSTYRGKQGYAVGFSAISDGGNWIIKGIATGNSKGHVGGSIGAGYQW
ncbi:YadA-like family protein [Neisseriaceae bacterium B1]